MTQFKLVSNPYSQEFIIAIPALGERKEMFDPLIEQMPQYTWLTFDLPGSYKELVTNPSILAFCEEMHTVMTNLQIEKAHLIGNSLGAWVIQAFATKYPSEVCSLTLLDGGYYFLGERSAEHQDETLNAGIENYDDVKAAIHEFTYSMFNLKPEAYAQFEHYFLNNYIRLRDGFAHHFHEQVYNAFAKELVTTNHCLINSAIPMHLIIAGASADEFSKAKATEFASLQKRTTLTTLENGQHYLPLTNTEELSVLLKNYFKKLHSF